MIVLDRKHVKGLEVIPEALHYAKFTESYAEVRTYAILKKSVAVNGGLQ